tara:strand:+ start:266 stop:487 length:222 start_codon:yes stop_codon:yes gene_type:complete
MISLHIYTDLFHRYSNTKPLEVLVDMPRLFVGDYFLSKDGKSSIIKDINCDSDGDITMNAVLDTPMILEINPN